MANIIKIKRGLKADIAKLQLVAGELGVALDTGELYVGNQNDTPVLVKAASTGVVASASKLDQARNITISGAATGTGAFDGSQDIEIALTLANSGVTPGTYTKVSVNEKGIITYGDTLSKTDLPTIEIIDISGLKDALDAKATTTALNEAKTELQGNINTLSGTVNNKANSTDVYKKSETYTRGEIDAKIDAKDSLPIQTGNAGKFLTTNGTSASWATVDLSSKADASVVEELTATVATKAAKDDVYTKTEINTTVSGLEAEIGKKANADDVYTAADVNDLLDLKADKNSVYTTGEIDEALAKKANSATTLAGYGITDAYTSDQVDDLLAGKADATTINATLATKASTESVNTLETNLTRSINTKATQATTLAGYTIGDAYTKDEIDGMIAGTFHFKGEADSYEALPTNAKNGDVYQVGDKEYAYNGKAWVELGFNIDLSAYATSAAVAESYATKTALSEGLADKADATSVYTKGEVDTTVGNINAAIAAKADATSVYTKGQVDTAVNAKADKATTLEGYGIEDAYTKTQVDTAVNTKATKATTLAGYGIADAYTKTYINTEVERIDNAIQVKLDANSVIDGGTFGGEDAE